MVLLSIVPVYDDGNFHSMLRLFTTIRGYVTVPCMHRSRISPVGVRMVKVNGIVSLSLHRDISNDVLMNAVIAFDEMLAVNGYVNHAITDWSPCVVVTISEAKNAYEPGGVRLIDRIERIIVGISISALDGIWRCETTDSWDVKAGAH